MPSGIYKRKERVSYVVHGMSKTNVYRAWFSMKARCDSPKLKSYPDYGGRGIKYDSRWNRFDFFWKDMGDSYKEGLTLERIDNNGHYCKENCKWIPRREQLLNTRRNVLVTFKGETKPSCLWAKDIGIHQESMRKRLKKWPLERALTEPCNTKYKNN